MAFKSLKDAYRKIYKEDVSVTFEDDSGVIQSFRLQDAYANILKRRIQADSGNIVDKYIDTIYNNADWGGSKQGPSKGVFKDVLLNANYDLSIELIRYLSENKEKLLSISSFGVGKVRNFIELIKSSLPGELIKRGIDDVIKQVHLSVIPKASTNVGRGESTFSFFGDAKKGRSGDLDWGNFVLEIKTGGDANSGAILGGDGYLNMASSRLKAVSEYVNIKVSDLNALEASLQKAVSSIATNGDKNFNSFKELYKKKNLFKSEKLNSAILGSDINSFVNQHITGGFTPISRPKAQGGTTLYSALVDKINQEREKSSKQGVNLPGQLASLLSEDSDKATFIKIFSELRTYTHTSINFKKQLTEFFNIHNHLEFMPQNDYINFERLIGAISLVSYTENNSFDLMLVINDTTSEGVIIDCRSKNIVNIFRQLENIPRLRFDLNIDVFEGGQWKSKTIIAKSPRIYLK